MKPSKRICVSAAMLLMLAGCEPQPAQPDPAAIAAASGAFQACAGCHGAEGEGNPALQAPALTHLDSWYLRRQLENFRDGLRGAHPQDHWGQQMAAQLELLADAATLEAVITQIESFPDRVPAATLEGKLENGRDRYNMTCGACHGPEAVGNLALNAPGLRGLDDWYLERQYRNFRDGLRGTHPADRYGAQMQRMGGVLATDQDIRDVAAWLASLRNDG